MQYISVRTFLGLYHRQQTFYLNLPKTTFNKAKTTAASRAVPKFFTPNPGTILAINIIRAAFITKVKRPKVKKLTGRVNKIRIGFRTIDNTPHTTATTPSVPQSTITIPGTIFAVIKNPRALINSCISISTSSIKLSPLSNQSLAYLCFLCHNGAMTESLKGIAGSMYAGKTDLLLREISRAEISKRKVQVFKPAIDNRWGEKDKVKSHSGGEHEACAVKNAVEILERLDPNTQVVAIDEIQFFDPKIIDVVQALLEADIRVIFTGLSQDFRGEPFGSMPTLLALCDEIEKPTAICTEEIDGEPCGAPATKTQRLINGKPAKFTDPVVLIGAEEEGYHARCLKHHQVPDKPVLKIKPQSR